MIWTVVKLSICAMNHPGQTAVAQPNFLQCGNGARNIRALLRFLDALRPFLHAFFHADALALENRERVFVQVGDCQRERRLGAFVNARDVWADFRFAQGTGVSQNSGARKNARRFGNQLFRRGAGLEQLAAQLRSGNWKNVSLQPQRGFLNHRMQRILDVVRNARVRVFRQRALDGDVITKTPGLERVERDDFDKRSERATSRFLFVGSVLEHGVRKRPLQSVYGWITHGEDLAGSCTTSEKEKRAPLSMALNFN